MGSKRERGYTWRVRIRQTTLADIYVTGCTEEEANREPWKYCVLDEKHRGTESREVLEVEVDEEE